jgi:hypothetical protein
MDADEIVPESVQRDHVRVVFQFLLNAFVSRVNRRMLILIVRFARSVWLVLLCRGSGLPVIVNAVMDALAPLGVKHLDMPATSQRIW